MKNKNDLCPLPSPHHACPILQGAEWREQECTREAGASGRPALVSDPDPSTFKQSSQLLRNKNGGSDEWAWHRGIFQCWKEAVPARRSGRPSTPAASGERQPGLTACSACRPRCAGISRREPAGLGQLCRQWRKTGGWKEAKQNGQEGT